MIRFKGWAVYQHNREFRKLRKGKPPIILPFDSPDGAALLTEMRTEAWLTRFSTGHKESQKEFAEWLQK